MNICLIIINYNGIRFLLDYMENISIQCQRNNISLIITDDQSTDDSVSYLTEKDYTVTINQSEKHGFAANVNNGIKYARTRDDFDYYIISNNDIELKDGLFAMLHQVLPFLSRVDRKVGLIGFDEISYDRIEYFKTYDIAAYNLNAIKQVNEIPGFFFIISRELVAKIGYMDEDYFMYGEDNDYFVRTRKAGYFIYNTFLPVMHYSEGSSTNDKLTSWYVYKNAFLYTQKNLGIISILRLLCSFIWKIYNPFYRSSHPSNLRVTRNGFIYNNYLLFKSLIWNFKYYFRTKI